MRRLVEYVALAFGFSWGVAGAYLYAGGRMTDPIFPLVAVTYMFGPLVAAAVVQARRDESIVDRIGARLVLSRWLVVAWIAPVLIAAVATGVALLHPDGSLAPDAEAAAESYGPALTPGATAGVSESLAGVPIWFVVVSVIVTGLLAGATINAVAAFGEEAGWRGLMLYELRGSGFWSASAVTGVVWGVWHVPLVAQGYNYPSNPALGVVVMVGFTVLASPLLSYVRLKSETVLAPSVFHGTVNATASLSAIVVVGVSGFVTGAGVATMVALAAANVAVLIYDRWSGDGVTSSTVGESLNV